MVISPDFTLLRQSYPYLGSRTTASMQAMKIVTGDFYLFKADVSAPWAVTQNSSQKALNILFFQLVFNLAYEKLA